MIVLSQIHNKIKWLILKHFISNTFYEPIKIESSRWRVWYYYIHL